MSANSSVKTTDLDRISDKLRSQYGRLGDEAAGHLAVWLSGTLPFTHPETIAALLRDDLAGLLFDSFWRLLPFGTGGRRGPVGYGPNRINPTVVAMTVQGHCDYLKSLGRPDPAVVVANDVRTFQDIAGNYRALGAGHPLLGTSSRSLARLAAEIYAGNGIRTYYPDVASDTAVMTTPMLSFAIRQLGAAGGVNLSASHNPPDDNGVKVYDEYGAQPIPPDDQRLADLMGTSTAVLRVPFDDAVRGGLVRSIPDGISEAYFRIYAGLRLGDRAPDPDAPITYTPLCGSGQTTVAAALTRSSYPVIVPPDQGPDGLFSVIPFRAPNPEVPHATRPAQVFADAHGSGLVLSSDPDADRVGADVRLSDGSWYHLDGNQIAAILTYALMLDPEGPCRTGLVIETLVTTRLVREIARKAGSQLIVDDLLVGFKYVADALQALAATGRYRDLRCGPDDVVIATEESHGILVTPAIRDKDATGPSLILAALYQRLRREHRTLLDYYAGILEEFGPFDCVNRSIMLRGADGIAKRDRIMESLRTSPPPTLAGSKVREVRDHWDTGRFGPFLSETDRAARNLIEFECGGFRLVVRPSGTEPKAKLYCEIMAADGRPADRGRALVTATRQRADHLARVAYGDLLARVGASLGEPALLLPDIVDLDWKLQFEGRTLPRVKAMIEAGAFDDLDDVLAWLRADLAQMTPGTDPLPAVRSAMALASRAWSTDQSPHVLEGLRDWAGGR
jgi:phosphoglucomutase/phosphomannomutase